MGGRGSGGVEGEECSPIGSRLDRKLTVFPEGSRSREERTARPGPLSDPQGKGATAPIHLFMSRALSD
jgi:hypothetical protein